MICAGIVAYGRNGPPRAVDPAFEQPPSEWWRFVPENDRIAGRRVDGELRVLTFLRDLRYSARSLSRTPGLTAALLFTVALGIGSYATVAGFTNGLQGELTAAPDSEGHFKLARLSGLLSWTVALVLLTATANVAGLLLSRSTRRTHETAARAALGATRPRLALHVVADSVVISIAGGLLGALFAYWTSKAFPALLYSEDAERLRMSGEVALVIKAALFYSVTMMIGALGPISQLRRQGPMTVLRRSGDGATTSVGSVRSVLVVAQMTTCVLLVIGSAVLLEGFRSAVRTLRSQQIGEPIVAIMDARAGFGRPDRGREFFAAAERAVSRIPGVTGVAWTSTLPGARTVSRTMRFEQAPIGAREAVVDTLTSGGGLVLAQRVKAGRRFGGMDGANTCPVTIVNEAAEGQWFGGDALGRAIEDGTGRRVDIVGVVAPRNKQGRTVPTFYFYDRQVPAWASEEVMERRFRLPILPEAPLTTTAEADVTIASGRYFTALGGAVVSGAGLEPPADQPCGIALVNREAADRFFGGDAIGAAVIDLDGHRAEIVGVVESPVLRVIDRTLTPMVYFPTSQRYVPHMTMLAQTDAATPELVAAIEEQLNGVDGSAGKPQVMTLEERLVRTALGPERIATVLVAVCAGLALALGLIGVYGVMADAVRQRQREIALRIALGAPASTIVYGVFRDGIRLAGTGAAAGMIVAWLLLRLVLHADDGFAQPAVWVWIACPLVLLVIVSIATVLPAKWALAVNPLTIARQS
jgi:hypothetical protein